MNGGGLFETGGGSAPKTRATVHQRSSQMGFFSEFLALAVSLEYLSEQFNNDAAKVLSSCLDQATEQFLDQKKFHHAKSMKLIIEVHFYLCKVLG